MPELTLSNVISKSYFSIFGKDKGIRAIRLFDLFHIVSILFHCLIKKGANPPILRVYAS